MTAYSERRVSTQTVSPEMDHVVIVAHGPARVTKGAVKRARALVAPDGRVLVIANTRDARKVVDRLQADDAVESASYLGGLIVRGALTQEPVPVRPGRIVMIGPPNKGVELPGTKRFRRVLGWLYGRPLLDVATPSEIMDDLGVPDAALGIIAGTRQFHPVNPSSWVTAWLHRHRPHDGTVEVARTHLDEMDDFIEVDAGHTFICDDAEVVRQTIYFLEHGEFSPAAR